MLPFGLQFQTFPSPKKIPMRLEQGSMDDFKRHLYKIANVDCPTEKKGKRKNKTKKIHSSLVH